MQFISDDDLFRRLAFDNPWWEPAAGKTEILPLHPLKRAFFPPFLTRVMKAGAGDVLVLAGPLGAGKTVMAHQIAAALIEKGTQPKNVFYCPLAAPSYTGARLEKLLDLFTGRHGHDAASEFYVFFDEIQYLPDWEKTMLALADAYQGARFVGAVSSAAPRIITGEMSSEGRVSTFVLPPSTFLEFLRFRGSEEKLFGAGAKKAGAAMTVSPRALRALNDEFHRYVNSGGFPEGAPAEAEDVPASTFIGDGAAERIVNKALAGLAGVNEPQELNRLFATLAFNTGLEVSIEELAKAAGMAKNTLRKYLDYLEHAFLIRRLPRVDRAAKRFQRARAFKVYLTSASLYTALFGPAQPGDEVFPRLAETALVAQWLGADAAATLAYAGWKGGGIDLLSIDPKSNKPDHVYELDWDDAYAAATNPQKNLAGFAEETNPEAHAYILTRTTAREGILGRTDITLAPLALYAYWLSRDPMLRRFHAKD